MSYSIDANLLLYASNRGAPEFEAASRFVNQLPRDPDLLCLTWPALMAYQRIATHPAIFERPLSAAQAWSNVARLLALPRSCVLTEDAEFNEAFGQLVQREGIRGNLVPDAHIAALLQRNGVNRIYTVDSDFRKFSFLEVVNPLAD